ncbi:D-hexose-6-phosphate mutarotase [Photorhabdus heterorhabditis]|uniref:D-hexose-6-phosphate mutarotase n=1 Tax=Photorhabdus heterorhabditis TaxID=880156 RepID=UPI001562BAA4|nr:D-hexose-6-phosphate mutarotase [Photorhabdus heterorhabditis]NRN27609.1 D-hexose-6-phosphate mutarotase [Photorhabdus heterorhabditis subsp. aluminescens]
MNDKIFALPVAKQISPSISQRNMDELPLIVISHPKVRGAISLQGAHLISWQPKDQEPGLWLSKKTSFKAGTAIRGGVPICWPWFGSAGTPSHGFARILPWEFSAHNEHENGVILTFTLRDNEYTHKLWPYDFTLIARFKLSDTCEVELETYGNYQATCALHTYLNVSDINQISISGLGKHYIDTITGKEQYTAEEYLIFNDRIDRIYTEPEDFSLIRDKSLRRTIEIHHYHHSDIVCWNPGAELSGNMKDICNEDYKNMVCVETARINKPLITKDDSPAHISVTIRSRKDNP